MIKNILLQNKWLDELIGIEDYAGAALLLFEEQLNEWKLMKENYEGLKNVKVKSFLFDGFRIKVQFNPARIKSTSADVSEAAVSNRECFLCYANLPPEQKGILILDEYLLLCNPYPVFSQHFTITSVLHKPQSIQKTIKEFLAITKLLSGKHTLIYNGPQCGASAPDHLHFQAGRKLFMPIEDDINQLKNERGKIIYENNENIITFIDDGLRTIVFIESQELEWIANCFEKFYRHYSELTDSAAEPMMNMLAGYNPEFGFSLIIFLRSKHRPACFYWNDEKKLIVSPAAIDLGGIIIIPGEEDFNKFDKPLVQSILSEVSLDRELFALLAEKLREQFD